MHVVADLLHRYQATIPARNCADTGKMIADGIMPWPDPLSVTFRIMRVNGKLMGAIIPPIIKKAPKESQEADKPGDEAPEVKSLLSLPPAYELMVKGMGLDPTLFVMEDSMTDYWNGLEDKNAEELWQIMQDGMGAYEKYAERNEQLDPSPQMSR